jgi:hypothetical protein
MLNTLVSGCAPNHPPAPSADVWVTATILQQFDDGREDQVVASTVQKSQQGSSVFSSLTITATGRYAVRISAGGLLGVTCAPFRISHGSFAVLRLLEQLADGVGGQALQQQPIVALEDIAGNRITLMQAVRIGVEVLTDLGTPAPLSALASATPAQTASYGIAMFHNISIATAGTYRLRFFSFGDVLRNIGNITVLSQTFKVMPGSPQSLSLQTMVGGCLVQQVCMQQPVIVVMDAGGNPVPWAHDGSVRALLREEPRQSRMSQSPKTTQELGAWNVVLGVAGVAQFSGVKAHKTGAFALLFAYVKSAIGSPDLRGALSAVFYVSTAAAVLQVNVQPEGDFWSPQSGRELLQQPVVSVRGSDANVVDLDGSWYISASTGGDSTTNPHAQSSLNSARLTVGTTIVSARNGIARFTNLKINVAFKCYALRFALGTLSTAGAFIPAPAVLSVLSSPFEVSIGNPWQILLLREPGGIKTGQLVAMQPVVAIADAAANIITRDSRSTVTASLINVPPHFNPGIDRCPREHCSFALCPDLIV